MMAAKVTNLGVLLLPLALLGCKTSPRVVTAIAQSSQRVSPEIFLIERNGMLDAVRSLSLKVDWRGPDVSDPQRQIDIVEDATRAHHYGIVVTPVGGSAIDTSLQNALNEGIPVVMTQVQTGLSAQPHLSFLLEDYEADARAVTDRLRKLSLSSGTVVILGVDTRSINSLHRLDALETALRRDCPALHVAQPIVAPFGSGYIQVQAERLLEQHNDLVAFIALNSRAGLGADVAVQNWHAKQKIAIITFDPAFAMLLGVRQGTIDSIVAQNMRDIGRTAIGNVIADHEGRTYNHTRSFAPLLVSSENIDASSTQAWLQFNPEAQP